MIEARQRNYVLCLLHPVYTLFTPCYPQIAYGEFEPEIDWTCAPLHHPCTTAGATSSIPLLPAFDVVQRSTERDISGCYYFTTKLNKIYLL